MTDLSRMQYPTEFFTIKVHNYKDDPTGEDISLHGLFTDKAEAESVAKSLVPDEYNGFLSAMVEPLHFGTIEQVAQEQSIGWIPEPTTPTTPTAAPLGSYSNPTPQSIAAEVAAEVEVMEAIRAEGEAADRQRLDDDSFVEGIAEGSSYNDGYEGEAR